MMSMPAKYRERGLRRRRSVMKNHWKQRMGRTGNTVHDFVRGLKADGFVFYSGIVPAAKLKEVRAVVNSSLVDHGTVPGATSTGSKHVDVLELQEPYNLHPRLDRLTCNEALQQVARQYLGSGAGFESMRLQRLDAGGLHPQQHSDILWHRSTEGRKLLLLLFLQDDKPGSRGIEVVQGSHMLHYYTTKYRHYDDEAVSGTYPENIIRLHGNAGDALLLDANMLHRDEPKADLPRDVLLLELVDWTKYDLMGKSSCSQVSKDEFVQRLHSRDDILHLACPHPLLEVVQGGLDTLGLPKLSLVQATVGMIFGISLLVFIIFDVIRRHQDPQTQGQRVKRLVPPRKPARSHSIFRRKAKPL